MIDKFAPTPQHGAAYAVVIERVGGTREIASCSTEEKFAEHKKTLDGIVQWLNGQDPKIQRAYYWAINRVKSDLRNRLDIYENSRKVNEAMATLPKPE